jgi:hypothetical protein
LSTLRALELETPELPTVRYPDTPGPLADLAMKLLEKKPDKRPASAQAVLETFEAIEKGMAAGSMDTTSIMAPHDVTLREARPLPPTSSKRRFPIVPAVIVAACLAAGAAYIFWPPQSTKQDAVANNSKDDAKPNDVQPNPAVKPAPLPLADIFDENRNDFKVHFELLNANNGEEGVRRLTEGHLRFKIEVEQDSYVGVWFKADDGSFTQFFPNADDGDNFLQKGKVYEFPRNKDYTFEATPSKKLEIFRVVATTKPWSGDATNAEQGYRRFRDATEFNENLRGVVLKGAASSAPRITHVSVPVWVMPK